jgi:hypothetical protein
VGKFLRAVVEEVVMSDKKYDANWNRELLMDSDGGLFENAKSAIDVQMKPSNPKDVLGSKRIPLDLIHPVTLAEGSLAMVEGMLKYGKWNFLAVGVRTSIYIGAALRHLFKYYFGQERDPKTGVHHLGSVIACVNIIFAAQSADKLTDDRPISNDKVPEMIDEFEARVGHLQELFKDFNPKHYSIEDDPLDF